MAVSTLGPAAAALYAEHLRREISDHGSFLHARERSSVVRSATRVFDMPQLCRHSRSLREEAGAHPRLAFDACASLLKDSFMKDLAQFSYHEEEDDPELHYLWLDDEMVTSAVQLCERQSIPDALVVANYLREQSAAWMDFGVLTPGDRTVQYVRKLSTRQTTHVPLKRVLPRLPVPPEIVDLVAAQLVADGGPPIVYGSDFLPRWGAAWAAWTITARTWRRATGP